MGGFPGNNPGNMGRFPGNNPGNMGGFPGNNQGNMGGFPGNNPSMGNFGVNTNNSVENEFSRKYLSAK